jgi:LemA protein
MIWYVVSGLLLLVAIYLVILYNSFVRLSNSVKEAFATMDVYLKKRWDLIPNLVEVVKGYAGHESGVLQHVVALRNSSYGEMSSQDKIDVNEKLATGLPRLFALAENYPDLKASQNFSDLSARLSRIEDEIANARKYYNAVVKKLNIAVEMFPSNMVAMLFGFKQAKMFEAQAKEKESVEVKLS